MNEHQELLVRAVSADGLTTDVLISGLACRTPIWRAFAVPEGMSSVQVLALNDRQEAVGSGSSGVQAFPLRWTADGSAYRLPGVGRTSSLVDLNDNGQAVGSGRRDQDVVPIFWDGSQLHVLPMPGTQGAASALNLAGEIVGHSARSASDRRPRPVIWLGMTPHALPTPDDAPGEALHLNQRGRIVGFCRDREGLPLPLLWEGLRWHELPRPDGVPGAVARSVNLHGDVVGETLPAPTDPAGATRALLWTRHGVVDLNTLLDDEDVSAGWQLTSALKIDDAGAILVQARQSGSMRTEAGVLRPQGRPTFHR